MKALLRLLRTETAGRFIPAFSSRFSSTILSFFVLLTASHFLPTQEYGLYVFLFSIGSGLGLIAVLGQQILVVKHYRRTEPTSDPQNQALIDNPAFDAWVKGRTPARRWGRPDELAGTCVYLASSASDLRSHRP